MAKRQLPSPEVLRQLMRYEPDTGKMFWKERGPELFRSDRGSRSLEARSRHWNSTFSGKEALIANSGNGYFVGRVLGISVTAHRVAWCLYFSEWPEQMIDHINGIGTDNRILNLRLSDNEQNGRNAHIYRSNTTGVAGVHVERRSRKFRASIFAGGKTVSLGSYDDLEAAEDARRSALAIYGFSDRHGQSRQP